MKILVVIPMPDGTALYRSFPYYRLGYEIVEHKQTEYIGWPELYNVDVCFFQRPANQIDVVNIEYCKRMGKPVIIDYDDNGFDLDPDNPAYYFYSRDDKQECMRECLRLADVVTVTQRYLGECLIEQVPTANIEIVPNAIDDKMFHVEPSNHIRNKIIAMRGGSSHTKDWDIYKDAILEIMDTYPEYALAVMGHHPEWLKKIDPNRIRYFKFQDIPTYFDHLLQLKPEIALVPLEDTKFANCKSNIAWIEFTIAGAAVLAQSLHMFRQPGCITFDDAEDLKKMFKLATDPELRQGAYELSLQTIPKLSDVNEKRKDIIEKLIKTKKLLQPKTVKIPPATDEQFHKYSLSHGHTQDDPHYEKAHQDAADYLIKYLDVKTSVELGCGTGGTLVSFLRRGVMAYGIELNHYSVEYFKESHPMYVNQIFHADITKEPIENVGVGDLVLSIEVFEHIAMPEDWWTQFISDLSKKFKYFYFSSTPYADSEHFDGWWNHCNVRRTTDWISLFESNGWSFFKNPRLLTSWDCLFKSTNLE